MERVRHRLSDACSRSMNPHPLCLLRLMGSPTRFCVRMLWVLCQLTLYSNSVCLHGWGSWCVWWSALREQIAPTSAVVRKWISCWCRSLLNADEQRASLRPEKNAKSTTETERRNTDKCLMLAATSIDRHRCRSTTKRSRTTSYMVHAHLQWPIFHRSPHLDSRAGL